MPYLNTPLIGALVSIQAFQRAAAEREQGQPVAPVDETPVRKRSAFGSIFFGPGR